MTTPSSQPLYKQGYKRLHPGSRPQNSAHHLCLLTEPPSVDKIHQLLTVFVAPQCTSWKDLSKSPSHFPEKGSPSSEQATTSWSVVPKLPERPARGRPPGKEGPFQVKPKENCFLHQSSCLPTMPLGYPTVRTARMRCPRAVAAREDGAGVHRGNTEDQARGLGKGLILEP